MTMIPARPPFTAPQLGKEYNRDDVRTQLARLAQSVAPTTGRSVVAATTILVTDDVIYCDATDAPFTVTLLPAAQCQFLKISIIKTDASANAVTIGGTVSGALNPTLATQYKSKTIVNNGSAWYTLASV